MPDSPDTDAVEIIEPCPECGQLIDVTGLEPFTEVSCPACGAQLRARKQFNNFTLVELLGEGGMGSVFKAIDLNLRREVALKILKRAAGSTESDWQKLESEARVTASINHPHVVKVFSFGEDHGQFYLAMELVEKGSLDDLMTLQGRVGEMQVLDVGIQIAQGLGAAHEHGLLHRDVKPGNILFADAKTAKIVDFGLAVVMDEGAQERQEIWGTPYYIAPEKLDNRPEDFRSDIYSLGGTLFHAVAGRPPFEATTASMVALKHIKSQAVSLQAFAPDVSSETAYVVNRMLNKDPEERYESYEELAGHLSYAKEKLLERIKKPAQKKERVQVESEKSRATVGLVWLVTLLVLAAVGAGVWFYRDTLFARPDGDASARLGLPANVMEINRRTAEARSELEIGDPATAAMLFNEAANEIGAPQPQRNWALAGAGVAWLLADNSDKARQAFQNLSVAAAFSSRQSEAGLVAFFRELGNALSGKASIPESGYALAADSGYQSFALLALGARLWADGDPVGGGELLERFANSNPGSDAGWISEFKPAIEPLVEEYRIYGPLKQRADAKDDLANLLNDVDLAMADAPPDSNLHRNLEALAAQIRAEIE